ncbi:ECF transporter S component [Ignavigranum ruoffiae]|uniref:ECF transporter S component n=1 Tax=Ignavigranum ruoffiae TaxID=89093 RepID=UPI0024AD8A16|nr:ECF transporter S component [Ignavigranum ruoffiae]
MSTKYSHKETQKMTILALFVAILIIQSFVPGLGYIPIGPLHATIVQVTVIIGGIFFGIKMGVTLGAVWGILSLLRSILTPNILTPVIMNPLISVLPRILVGLIASYVFIQLNKKMPVALCAAVAGALGSILNTILFLGAIYLFAAETYASALSIDVNVLFSTLLAIVGTNGVPEALVSGVLTPLIVSPIYQRVTSRFAF